MVKKNDVLEKEEKQDIDNVPLTKPKRERSQKQIEAFKIAQEKRNESIKLKKEQKILEAQKALLEKEGLAVKPLEKNKNDKKIYFERDDYDDEKEDRIHDNDYPPLTKIEPNVNGNLIETKSIAKQVKSRKKEVKPNKINKVNKKQIIYEESSTEEELEEESSSSSSSEEEIVIIKKKSKQKKIKEKINNIPPVKSVVQRPQNQVQQDWSKFFI